MISCGKETTCDHLRLLRIIVRLNRRLLPLYRDLITTRQPALHVALTSILLPLYFITDFVTHIRPSLPRIRYLPLVYSLYTQRSESVSPNLEQIDSSIFTRSGRRPTRLAICACALYQQQSIRVWSFNISFSCDLLRYKGRPSA